MKKNMVIVGILCITLQGILYSVGEKNTNTSGRDEGSKYNVVFEGVLTTQEGHVYKVNEINFNKLIKQIPVFEMPAKESYDTDGNIHILKKNPNERLEITKLDLSEISMIQIPYPDSLWYYKRMQTTDECTTSCNSRYKISDDPRALKFIEIKVTDKTNKEDHYLVEANKKIYCSEITSSGPKEKDVQLPAIKTLTITGYHKREEEKENTPKFLGKENTKGECICPAVKNEIKEKREITTLKTSNRNKRVRSTKIVRVS